jgi:peroxiredoxin Q/BCP
MGYATSLFMMPALLVGSLVVGSAPRRDEVARIGDSAPEFKCLDDRGQVWDSRDHIGKGIVVLYFYPSDFSFCCTRQARGYQDRLDKLAQECIEVVGISCDTVEAHQQFKSVNGLKFALLSDAEGQVAQQFGVPLRTGGKAMAVGTSNETIPIPRKYTAARWTFIIGLDGRIIYRDTEVSPVKDSQIVLKCLTKP